MGCFSGSTAAAVRTTEPDITSANPQIAAKTFLYGGSHSWGCSPNCSKTSCWRLQCLAKHSAGGGGPNYESTAVIQFTLTVFTGASARERLNSACRPLYKAGIEIRQRPRCPPAWRAQGERQSPTTYSRYASFIARTVRRGSTLLDQLGN